MGRFSTKNLISLADKGYSGSLLLSELWCFVSSKEFIHYSSVVEFIGMKLSTLFSIFLLMSVEPMVMSPLSLPTLVISSALPKQDILQSSKTFPAERLNQLVQEHLHILPGTCQRILLPPPPLATSWVPRI